MSSTNEAIPLPPPTEIFAAVKESCKSLRETSGLEISQPAIQDFLSSLEESEWSFMSIDHGTKLPLKFDNFLSEVTIMTLLELLNFCSGYRDDLKRLKGRDAMDTIRAFILSLHISRSDLSPKGLESVTIEDIATMMQIPVMEDVEHETITGVFVSMRNSLWQMVTNVRDVMVETGGVLRMGGYGSLGGFVIECAKRSKVEGKEEGISASVFIHHMVSALPAFRDMAIINSKPVYIFKKIQLLVLDLHNRFSSTHPDLFSFHDISFLPIFSDNVIPTMLHHLRILPLTVADSCSPQQRAIIEELKEDLGTGRDTTFERSYILRAAAVDACEEIVKVAQGMKGAPVWVRGMSAVDLDAYLWKVAKVGAFRHVVRFSDPNTVFF